MKYDFETLEFEEFKNILKSGFSSYFAAELLRDMMPLSSADEISQARSEIAEAVELANDGRYIEIDDAFFELIKKIDTPQFSIEIIDFIIIKNFLAYISNIKVKLSTKRLNILKNIVFLLNTLPTLHDEIVRCIDDKGEIKDDATPELKAIRRGMNEHRNRIRKILNDTLNSGNADKFIQDKVIVLRNGRYTVPCKTNFGQYIQGIIHDKSASGQTLYIEPSSCVGANNAMQELIISESEEIAKILYNLLSLLKSEIPELKQLTQNYAHLAFRLETGAFYNGKPHSFGELSDIVLLRGIHHPLLYLRKGSDSIPIDFEIGRGISSCVITGPNTGGKTAALKSVGLNHLITFCGFPVFARSAKFVFFDSILADIGDKQSLVMDLSTFSSHMLNIKTIAEGASQNTLVLLDELGTGTEPREGASIAVAVLKYLERKGAVSIVTTHFPEVKDFALNSSSASFYAVDFDYDTFAPRYRLIKDILGKSDPILIAKRLGFSDEIIDAANHELSKYKTSIEMQVEELNRARAEAEHTKRQLEEREQQLSAKEKVVTSGEAELKKRLNSKELELLEEAYALLQKGKRIAEEKTKAKPDELKDAIKDTAEKIEKLKSQRSAVQGVVVGDVIFLERYGKTAKVLSIESDTLHLNMEGMRVKLNKREAVGHKVSAKQESKVKITSAGSFSAVRHELLLVGKRVEEAIDMLDKFVDEALMANYEKIYIIHGRGSGQLRKAVQDHLRQMSGVKKYRLADNTEGGNAITIAEF